MGKLQQLNILVGEDNQAEIIFDSLFPDFQDIQYDKPSEFVSLYWNKYLELSDRNNSNNGKLFECIIAALFVRENLLPLYVSAQVAFVPNVEFDLMLYTSERGPICLSLKTSLRERYKQADLEAIALKYVHRKALCYLITLNEREASGVKNKIKSGFVIGLDDVLVANNDEFDELINSLKEYKYSEAGEVKIIHSTQIVTEEKIRNLL